VGPLRPKGGPLQLSAQADRDIIYLSAFEPGDPRLAFVVVASS